MEKMRANVFRGKDEMRVEEVERPRAGVGEVVIRVISRYRFNNLLSRAGSYNFLYTRA